MKSFGRRIWVIAFVLTLFFTLTLPSQAQAPTTIESAISVAPAILEAVLPPDGMPIIKEVSVANTTNFAIPIKGQVGAFLANETIPKSESDTFNASAWFQLEPADFILQPKETKKVKITITAPPDVEPGGHYATVYFQPLIPAGVINQQSSVSLARVGILTFLIAPGDVYTELELKSLHTTKFKLSGPTTFELEMENLGSIHLNPLGSINITNMMGKEVAVIDLPRSVILPSTTKKSEIIWQDRLPIPFGRFTAKTKISYGEFEPTNEITQTFWIVPLHLIIPGLILLTIVIKIVIVLRQRIPLVIGVLKRKK